MIGWLLVGAPDSLCPTGDKMDFALDMFPKEIWLRGLFADDRERGRKFGCGACLPHGRVPSGPVRGLFVHIPLV